jgi:hypothetical protein
MFTNVQYAMHWSVGLCVYRHILHIQRGTSQYIGPYSQWKDQES